MRMNSRMLMGRADLALPPAPVITTVALDGATEGEAYAFTLMATGSGITWSLESGTLPDGITLNPATGELSGTPTESGTFGSLVFRATNTGGDDEATLSLEVAAAFGLKWTDDFERTDSAALGGDWTEVQNGFRIVSGFIRETGTFAPCDAWAGGAAIAVAKNRMRLTLHDFTTQSSAADAFLAGFRNGNGGIFGTTYNGYVLRGNGSSTHVARVEAGVETRVATNVATGLDFTTAKTLAIEIEKSGTSAIIRVLVNGTQIGSDITDATPGDAFNVFTSATPAIALPQNISSNYKFSASAVSVHY